MKGCKAKDSRRSDDRLLIPVSYHPSQVHVEAAPRHTKALGADTMPAAATAQPLSSFLAAVHQRAADIERADKAQRTAAVRAATAIHAIPKAVVLVVTVATCECGAVHRNANPNVMVRYDAEGFQNSVHYRLTKD